jgi:DNA helicase-2/ATP-dependent DNA helicase PcrA
MLNLDILNDEQRQAVLYIQGPLLVLAGAGTGKTTVITQKIAYLLQQNIYNAQDILAVTFTNKAAEQMQSRIERLCAKRLPHIGTFHSIALKILKNHAELVGLKSNLVILDYADQIKLLKNIYLDHKFDNNKLDHKFAHHLITTWKDLSLLPKEVEHQNKLAISVYHHYQQYLKNSNLVDFSDILLYVNYIFNTHQDIKEMYQDRFKYVLVDEYQDTNKAQYDWIKSISLKHQNLACVGDDDQSIYSWRGAQIYNILNFSKEFANTKIITLSQNYRSTQNILDAAQSIIQNNENRYTKKLVSGRSDLEQVNNHVKLIQCDNTEQEAEFIAQELTKSPINHQQAVLVRTNFQTRVLEDIFIRHQIPYIIIGSVKFYDLKEIKDAVCYIRSSINHHDDVALERIINTPKRSIGQVTLANIRKHAIDNNLSLFASINDLLQQGQFSKKITTELTAFIGSLTRWQKDFQVLAPSLAAQKVLDESGYTLMLNKNVFEYQRIDNIKELFKAISDHPTIDEFINYISLVNSKDNKEDEQKNAVRIMTVHAAKGLEFDTVFLPNWSEGVLPSPKALSDTNPLALEEERRIAYVGITRAKNALYISYSTHVKTRENYYISQEPSRFIAEITPSLIVKENYPKIEYTKIFLPGARVNHKVFGYGLIIKVVDDTKYEIGFAEHGIKLIHKDFLSCAS